MAHINYPGDSQHPIIDQMHHRACEICLLVYLPQAIKPDYCLGCDSVQSCPKAINYCQDCSNSLYKQPDFRCELCDSYHLIPWIKCKVQACTNYINRNLSEPKYYSVYCEGHQGICLHCENYITGDQLRCSLLHSYHLQCFSKYPESFKNCRYCIDLYDSKIAELVNSQNGEVCSFCNLFIGESVATCLQRIFFCGLNCQEINRFLNQALDCNCERCIQYKALQSELRETLGICSKCRMNKKISYKSICGTVNYCEGCLNSFSSSLYLCRCHTCFTGEISRLKSCSICGVTKRVLNYKQCSYQNYYCDECITSSEKYKKIPMCCLCEECFKIYLKRFSELKQLIICAYCSNEFKPPRYGASLDSFYICRTCRASGMPHQFQCNCEGCFRYYPIRSNKKCLNHPNKPSNILTNCQKYFCNECIFQANIDRFDVFLNWFNEKNPELLNRQKYFNCPDRECKVALNLPVSFFLEKFNVFSRNSKNIIELFTPCFEGFQFNFYMCRCDNICAALGDCVIGCNCVYREEVVMNHIQ